MNDKTFSSQCLLTLSIPQHIMPELTDFLRNQVDLVSGFTLIKAQGFSQSAIYRTTLEQVKGAAAQFLIYIVIEPQNIDGLVDALKQQFKRVELFYWVTPILNSGRI